VKGFRAAVTFGVGSREFDRSVLSVRIKRAATVCADVPSAVPE
jgi:hypothetical protein